MNIQNIFSILTSKLNDVASRIESNHTFDNLVLSVINVAQSNYTKRVIVTGVGKNANLAAKASETYMSLGIPSFYGNTCHMSHGDYGCIGPDDVVIHLSRSGKTAEMVQASRHIMSIRPDVRQFLICCKEPDSINDYIDGFTDVVYLGDVKEFDANNLAPTTSTSVMLTVLDVIGVIASESINFSRKDFLDYHPGGSLGNMLEKEKENTPPKYVV